jgi:hypothetical protein
MMQAAKDRIRDNVPEPLDRARAGCVLPKRNVRSDLIIIGDVSCKNSPKMLFVEHNEMVSTLAPDRSDQALDVTILPGRAE